MPSISWKICSNKTIQSTLGERFKNRYKYKWLGISQVKLLTIGMFV